MNSIDIGLPKGNYFVYEQRHRRLGVNIVVLEELFRNDVSRDSVDSRRNIIGSLAADLPNNFIEASPSTELPHLPTARAPSILWFTVPLLFAAIIAVVISSFDFSVPGKMLSFINFSENANNLLRNKPSLNGKNNNKNELGKERMYGKIMNYECGDNCYLTIRTNTGQNITGLCSAPECRDWNENTEMPAKFIGKTILVLVGSGDQTTIDGHPMNQDFVSFENIEFVSGNSGLNQEQQTNSSTYNQPHVQNNTQNTAHLDDDVVYNGPSFSCSGVRQPFALIVCSDYGLSVSEGRVAQLYVQLRDSLSWQDKRELIDNQLNWNAKLLEQCSVPQNGTVSTYQQITVAKCLIGMYKIRGDDLLKQTWHDPAALPEYYHSNQMRMEAQQQLIKYGLLSGSADGIFGPKFRSALMQFQRNNGLGQTGYLDSGTFNKLVTSNVAEPPQVQTKRDDNPRSSIGASQGNNSNQSLNNARKRIERFTQ